MRHTCTKYAIILTISLLLLGVAIPGSAANEKTLMMATTTSTDNTGLLDYSGAGIHEGYWYRVEMDRHRNRKSSKTRRKL